MPKLGVVIGQETLDWLEQPLSYGDSRSERVRDSLSVARAAEQALIDNGYVEPSDEDLEAIVYEAVDDWCSNQTEADGGSKQSLEA